MNKESNKAEAPDDLVSDAYGATANFAPEPKQLAPQPWHRPRKHWVREQQWLLPIGEFIDSKSTAQAGVLKYMTLPGPDLLDVRMIGELCRGRNCQLKLLGFNDGESGGGASPSDALAPLSISGLVSRDSWIHPDKFQSIVDASSMGRLQLESGGAMDVINLDLCNSFMAYAPQAADPTNYAAVKTLFDFQRQNRHQPFLVFLTTRVDRPSINKDAFARLAEVLFANCRNATFEAAVRNAFGIGKQQVLSYKEGRSFPGPQLHAPVMLLGLSKWMLTLLLGGVPKWSIDLLSCCTYSIVSSGGQEMLSLCYRCEMIKTASIDSARLAPAHTNGRAPLETDFALALVEAARGLFDLDEQIAQSGIYEDLARGAASYMEQAGFDRDAYLRWCFDPAEHPLLRIPQRRR